jgi:hypothetical protein
MKATIETRLRKLEATEPSARLFLFATDEADAQRQLTAMGPMAVEPVFIIRTFLSPADRGPQ